MCIGMSIYLGICIYLCGHIIQQKKLNGFNKILFESFSAYKKVSHGKIPQICTFSNNVFLEILMRYVIIFTLVEIC